MNINAARLHFEQYLQGQVNAVVSIKKLAFVDEAIALSAFNISSSEIKVILSTHPEKVIQVGLKNSQLFRLSIPDEETLNKGKCATPIGQIRFNSPKVKQSIYSYCQSQRQCFLAIKSIFDISSELARVIFNLSDRTMLFLNKHNSFDIAQLSDRHAWFINLNNTNLPKIFDETLERVSFEVSFVESSLLY